MGYPERLLGQGERIELAMRPHGKVLIGPVFVLFVTCAVGGFLASIVPSGGAHRPLLLAIGLVGLVLILGWTVRPWLRWLNMNYVITNQRLIIREGIIKRDGRDIPLTKINDVSFSFRSILDRMLGCGILVVESAGVHGQITLDDIPHVEHTQRELTQLIEGAPVDVEDVGADYDDGPAPARRRR